MALRKRDALRNLLRRNDRSQTLAASREVVSNASEARAGSLPASTPDNTPSSNHDDILDAALLELNTSERDTIRLHLPNVATDVHVVIEHVYDIAVRQRESCEGKQWKLKLSNRTFVLRDEAAKIVRWLDRFKAAGDVLANADPIHVGIPWAGIRILLEIALADHHQTAALVTGLSLALSTTHRLQVYLSFLSHLSPSQSTSNFTHSLVRLYAHVLRFLALALQTHSQTPLQHLSHLLLWRTSDLESFELVADRLSARAETDASNCDRVLRDSRWETLVSELRALELGIGQGVTDIQTSISNLDLRTTLSALPVVDAALYNSLAEADEDTCLEGTRTEILARIGAWAEDEKGKSIFWLCGMAGTGKSTILRTAAGMLDKGKGRLGASWFFKRGEGDRGSARRFFPTLAMQLAARVPGLGREIGKMLGRDVFAVGQGLREQFEKLLLGPLMEVEKGEGFGVEGLVVVVDALDECDRAKDVQDILALLAGVGAKCKLRLRVLVTSRPEVPIELGFKRIDSGLHEDVVLEEVQSGFIARDIRLFLEKRFREIRQEDLAYHPSEPLPDSWPAEDDLQRLVDLAQPLFIFAATVCRYVAGRNPPRRLDALLKQQREYSLTGIEATYLPILDQVLKGYDSAEQESAVTSFRRVVGSIVLLAESLSAKSLACILGVPLRDVEDTLRDLHSVLKIPQNPLEPIHLFHLSFRDFLVDQYGRGKHIFSLDYSMTHQSLGRDCLRLLHASLKRDICGVKEPGARRTSVLNITDHISTEVAYACRYWAWHLREGQQKIDDGEDVLSFLKTRFLHWVEALSWLGRLPEALSQLQLLQSMIVGSSAVSTFLRDAHHFIRYNMHIIDDAPLQLYVSAILFAPTSSIVRTTFLDSLMVSLRFTPEVGADWGSDTQVFEGKPDGFDISPDGRLLALPNEHVVEIWNIRTPEHFKTLSFLNMISSVRFFRGGERLFVGSGSLISVWDTRSWTEMEGYPRTLNSNDPDLETWAASDCHCITWSWFKPVIIWNMQTGQKTWDSQGSVDDMCIKISPENTLLALLGRGGEIRLVSVRADDQIRMTSTEPEQQSPEAQGQLSGPLAFSPDGKRLAVFSEVENQIVLLDVSTLQQTGCIHFRDSVSSLSYMPDGMCLALGGSGFIQFLELATGETVRTLLGHGADSEVMDIRLSASGAIMASGCSDETIRLWDLQHANGPQSPFAKDVPRSGHGTEHGRLANVRHHRGVDVILSKSNGGDTRLWAARTGEVLSSLWTPDKAEIHCATLSPNGLHVATVSSSNTLQLWDVLTGRLIQSAVVDSTTFTIRYSANGHIIITVGIPVRSSFWDAENLSSLNLLGRAADDVGVVYINRRFIEARSHCVHPPAAVSLEDIGQTSDWVRLAIPVVVHSFVVSPDSSLTAIGDLTSVYLFSSKTGETLKTFENIYLTNSLEHMKFSPTTSIFFYHTTSKNGDPSPSKFTLWHRSTNQDSELALTTSDWVQMMAIDGGDRFLAYTKAIGKLHLYDIGLKCELWSIDTTGIIQSLSFSPGSRFVETSQGRVDIRSSRATHGEDDQLVELYRTRNWIRRNGQDLIWLPPDFRGDDHELHSHQTAWSDNIIAIGQSSGLLSIFNFAD